MYVYVVLQGLASFDFYIGTNDNWMLFGSCSWMETSVSFVFRRSSDRGFWDLVQGTGIFGCGASGAISALYAGHLAAVVLVC